jgi:hypothetical protein
MKKSILFTLIIFLALSSYAQTIRYVSANSLGNGSGLSTANAADFLSTGFWSDIQTLLATQPVTVKFIRGNYSRAYTEKSLTIGNMGNPSNKLLLEGEVDSALFIAPTGYAKKSQLVKIINSVNVTVKNLHFKGNGSTNYVLNITTDIGKKTSHISVENCTWSDMRGIVYGATGATQVGTSHITFKNCTFKRVGLSAGSHMIYNAYGSNHIMVINCHFEDSPGDYVRFRDKCDYAIVKGCTFIHPQNIPSVKFISMPLYNDGIPTIGNESFGTNYSFTDNSFNSTFTNIYTFFFSNTGYTAPQFNYLLTPEEGNILTNGTNAQKKALVETNFGIFPDKVRIYNNTYSGVASNVYLGSYVNFGAISKGWTGKGDIQALINTNALPYTWELE